MLARQLDAPAPFVSNVRTTLHTFDEFEFVGWEALASAYDDAWGRVTSAFVDPMLKVLGEIDGRSVLDIATGPGYGTHLAAQKGARATGIDFSPRMIARARQLYPMLCFDVADARALPFADASFDAVMSNFGVQHFADLDKVFFEIRRVLKPGGICAFTVWADNSLNAAGEVLDSAVAIHAEGPTQMPAGPDYHELADASARRRFLIDRGFENATVQSNPLTVGWQLDHLDELYEAELRGSVRSGARLREQAPPVRARIRDTMASLIRENYRVDGGYVLPMTAHIVCGRRP